MSIIAIDRIGNLVKNSELIQVRELIEEQDFDNAILALNALDRSGESSAESQYLLGTIYHRLNKLGPAVQSFKRSLLLDPTFTDSAISLSIIYNDTGHYEEARKIFEQAEESVKENQINSSNSVVLDKALARKHVELGDLYRNIQRFDAAAHEYLKATKLDDKNLDARVNLAKTLAQRGQSKLAKRELEKVISENPNFIPARVNLALLLYSMGHVVDARMELQQAQVLSPQNELIKTYIALTESATETRLSPEDFADMENSSSQEPKA